MTVETPPTTGLDRTAFERFVATAGPSLLRTARLLTGDDHLAQDLVQSTFAIVWGHRHKLVEGREATAYARTVLVHQAGRWWRRRWRAEQPTDTLPETAAPGGDPDVVLAVRAALRTLPHRDRAVLVLRFFEDLPEAEVAAALGCTTSVVRNSVRRGTARLRALDWEGFEG